MADDPQDIFGKIDAILGKRAGFAGPRRQPEDEFPMLTDIVEEGEKFVASLAVPDALSEPPLLSEEVDIESWAGQTEPSARMAESAGPVSETVEPFEEAATDLEATPPETAPDESLSKDEIDRIALAIEAQLSVFFDHQQQAIEAMVRRIIREELDARRK